MFIINVKIPNKIKQPPAIPEANQFLSDKNYINNANDNNVKNIKTVPYGFIFYTFLFFFIFSKNKIYIILQKHKHPANI